MVRAGASARLGCIQLCDSPVPALCPGLGLFLMYGIKLVGAAGWLCHCSLWGWHIECRCTCILGRDLPWPRGECNSGGELLNAKQIGQ